MPGMIANYKAILDTPERRQVLMAMTAGQLLVQLSSLPVTLAVPSIARSFGIDETETALIVIVNLMVLGSTVFLGARLGDRFGHPKVFFIGAVIITLAGAMIVVSQSLMQIVAFRALQGLGAGLIHGNGNPMLAFAFKPEERGRAYAFPISGSRFGTLIGLGFFSIFLTLITIDLGFIRFDSWRLVFFVMLPIGALATWACVPMLKRNAEAVVDRGKSIDYLGALLLVATASAFLLGGSHLHGGEESYTSGDALSYHIPMHVLFVVLLGVFIFVERRVEHPFMEFRHFRQKYFSLALISNTMFHLSMLATMILVPIMIESGLGKAPWVVGAVLIPHQSFGIWLPMIAGNIHDKYNPRLLRTACMLSIAFGFVLLALFAGEVPYWWMLPLLLFPISIGTNIFNTVNNASVMSTLPTEHRGFASGMLETTRDLGHATGATLSSVIMGLMLPATLALMVAADAQAYYMEAFSTSALTVVGIMIAGAVIAAFHRPYRAPATQGAGGQRSQAGASAAD